MRFKPQTQNTKTLDRFNNAVNILLKYGVVSIATDHGLKRFLKDKNGNLRFSVNPELNLWERIRNATVELGPTAVYFAKFLCSRPDILPQPLIEEFSKLEFENVPFAKSSAIEIFEKYTKRSAEKTFSYFDNYCFLQDGYSRTYRAKLLTGEDVSVKILLPDTVAEVTADIKLLRRLAKLTGSLLDRIGMKNPTKIIDDFELTIMPKLNLNNEAEMVKRFAKAYKNMKDFSIPGIFSQFTSSNTLVTTYSNTTSITDAEEFTKWGFDHKKVADTFLRTTISGMLDSGLFLSAPMDSIIRISTSNKIVITDYGSTMLLTTEQRGYITDIVAALSTQNSKVLANSLRKIAISPEIFDYQVFKNEVQALVDNLYFMESSEHYMREFSFGIMRIAFNHKIKIPREVFYAFSSLAVAEDIALSITPTCLISEFFKPYGKKLQFERMSPERLKNSINQNISQATDFLENSPLELSLILKKLRRGQLSGNINIKDFRFFVKKMDTATNKIIQTIIICTLILSSSLILIFSKDTYQIFGVSIFALAEFGLALIMAISLIIYTLGTGFSANNKTDEEDDDEDDKNI